MKNCNHVNHVADLQDLMKYRVYIIARFLIIPTSIFFQDVTRYRLLGNDHACGCVFLLRMRLGLEDIAAKWFLRDTMDDSCHVTNLLIDADSLLAMDNYVRKVRC